MGMWKSIARWQGSPGSRRRAIRSGRSRTRIAGASVGEMLLASGCTTSQGSFGVWGSTRACCGDAVEAIVGQKLDGGAASWSEASTVCDFYNQHPNQGQKVDFWTTPQVFTPPTPGAPSSGGWGDCGYTKMIESTTGTVSASYLQLGRPYPTSIGYLCTKVRSGRNYTFNTLHHVRLTNGQTYWTNQAAGEWSHA
jgi:hypothetical protein